MLSANSEDDKLIIFYLIFAQNRICKFSPLDTICTECQILLSGKNKKIFQNVTSCNFYSVCYELIDLHSLTALFFFQHY